MNLADDYLANIEELALEGGIMGSGFTETLIEKLESEQDRIILASNDVYESRLSFVDRSIDSLLSDLSVASNLLESREEQGRELPNEVQRLRKEVENIEAERTGMLESLVGRRAEYPELLSRKRRNLRSILRSECINSFAEEENARFQIEESLLEIQEHRRDSNEKEYARRREHLEARLVVLTEKYLPLNSLILRLRTLGINETTNGFLVWAGYLGLPAFGWFLGESIRSLHGGSETIGMIVASVTAALNSFGGPRWIPLVVAILLPMVVLMLFLGFLFLLDRLMKKIDPKWEKLKDEKLASGPQSGRVFGFPWNDVGHSSLSRFDLLAVAKKSMFGFIILAGLFFISGLFSVAGVAPSAVELRDGLSSLSVMLYTYLGSVIGVAVSGLVLVYVFHVIGPRQERLAQNESWRVKDLLKANFELCFIVILFLVVLVFSDALNWMVGIILGGPDSPTDNYIWTAGRLTGPVFLLLINALCVSYGLLYRGMFRSDSAHRKILAKIETTIQRYAEHPILALPSDQFDSFSQELKQINRDVDAIYANLELEAFRDIEQISASLPGLRKLSFSLSGDSQRHVRHTPSSLFVTGDELFAQDLVGKIKACEQTQSVTLAELTFAEQKLVNQATKADDARLELGQIRSAIEAKREMRINLLKNMELERWGITLKFSSALMAVRSALERGKSLRVQLGNR